MGFPESVRTEALVRAHRRCSVCHEFAGRNINVHHIIPEAKGGPNDLENAISLCLRCHAEAGHYNPEHPLGTKYSPTELRRHRDQWWAHCKQHPDEHVGCGIDITHTRDSSSNGDLHTYWLSISFTNNSPTKQGGYVLELLFPTEIPVHSSRDYELAADVVTIETMRYQKLTIKSSDTIYRGQTIQIVDRAKNPLSYKMNHAFYFSDSRKGWNFRCNFFVGDLPDVRELIPWDEMHEF